MTHKGTLIKAQDVLRKDVRNNTPGSASAWFNLYKLTEAIPDLTATLKNANIEYSEEKGEWLIWCGEKQHAQNLIDMTRLLHEAIGEEG